MNVDKKAILDTVIDSLNDNNSVFFGITTNDDDGDAVISTTDDLNLISALILPVFLNNSIKSHHMDHIFNVDDLSEDEIESFVHKVTKAADETIFSKMKSFSNKNDGKSVHVVKVDPENHSGVLAIDLSDPSKLADDQFFQSMPDFMKKLITDKADELRKGKDNA